jgi:hypothetical protein
MKSRSLILFVIASICVQFVVGQDLGTAEPVSKTVVVDSKELVLNVSTGSMEDYEERKGPFNVRIGVCGISVTGYAFDPSVEFAKEYNTTVEKLYSFLRSKTKPSLRFDINDFNGSGGSITNVASITSIIATNMSITYFGKDAEGNDYSKEFKCNPKFGSAGDGKFNISMGIDGENVPRNFELTSSSDTTDPSPTASGLSYRALSMLIFVSMPICIAIAFSAIISCWIYCCWDFKQKEAAYAKEEAAEVAAKEKAAAKPKSPTKKKHRKKPSRSHDRDVEAQRDESHMEANYDSERTKKKKPRIEDSVMAFNPDTPIAKVVSKFTRVRSKDPKPTVSQVEVGRSQSNAPEPNVPQVEVGRSQSNAPKPSIPQEELSQLQSRSGRPLLEYPSFKFGE